MNSPWSVTASNVRCDLNNFGVQLHVKGHILNVNSKGTGLEFKPSDLIKDREEIIEFYFDPKNLPKLGILDHINETLKQKGIDSRSIMDIVTKDVDAYNKDFLLTVTVDINKSDRLKDGWGVKHTRELPEVDFTDFDSVDF